MGPRDLLYLALVLQRTQPSNSLVTADSDQSLTRVELLCCNSTTSCGPKGEGADTTTTSCGGQESGPHKGSFPAPRPRQDPNAHLGQAGVDSPLRSPEGSQIWWPPPRQPLLQHPQHRFISQSSRSTASKSPLHGTASPHRGAQNVATAAFARHHHSFRLPTRRNSHGPGS